MGNAIKNQHRQRDVISRIAGRTPKNTESRAILMPEGRDMGFSSVFWYNNIVL
jgi:hypothetical protein